MKHLQYSQTPASIDISLDAPGSEGKSRDSSSDLKRYKQTLVGSVASSHNQSMADNIKNLCLYILTLVLTGHAVVSKFKNFYGKNVLTTDDVVNMLRVIFLAARNLTPGQQQKIQSAIAAFVNQLSYGYLSERLLTLFRIVAPDLYIQIDTIWATSETVVTTLWQFIFIP